VIFPGHCKVIGHTGTKPCGEKVYFLSRYLLRRAGNGYEILEVEPDAGEKGMMRTIKSVRVLAAPEEIAIFPDRVQLHDRANLVRLAAESGKRCTVFTGLDEHINFVFDPDLSAFLTIHVYDIVPPRPSLSACIKDLEKAGLFGELSVVFNHHIRDISRIPADIFPCRAAGFDRTLDRDLLRGGERIAGCITGRQLYKECHGREAQFEEICPLAAAAAEPFIARCCRSEREGIGVWQGKIGAVVHWGALPAQIADAVRTLAAAWRKQDEDRSR
jgi:hypothetical protein